MDFYQERFHGSASVPKRKLTVANMLSELRAHADKTGRGRPSK